MALMLLLAFGVPLAVAFYSAARPTVWNAWDLIGSWPAFAVCVGALLTAARNAWGRVAIAAVIGAFTFGSLKMLESRYHRPDYTAAVRNIVSASPNPNAPVVNIPDFSPGPVVELETAFDLLDASQRHPILRLGRAPLAVESRARPFTELAPSPGGEVARQAVRLAGSGKLFLVTPDRVPIATLEALRRTRAAPASNRVIGIFAAFMRELPARFRLVALHSYTGMNRVTVYTFQG